MKKIIPLLLIFMSVLPAIAQDDGENPGKLGLAAKAMRNKQYREAEEIYRSLLKETAEDMALRQLLSHALINEKKFIEADSLLEHMQEEDSNNAGNYWYMGISAMNQQQDSIAADCYKKYLVKTEANAATQNAKAWLYIGSAYRRMMHNTGINQKQFDDMVYHYNHYVLVNPTDPFGGELTKFVEKVKPKRPEEGAILVWDEAN